MQIVSDAGLLARMVLGFQPPEHLQSKSEPGADVVDISDEALKQYQDSLARRMQNGTYTLNVLQDRVDAVYQEIDDVWESALPDKEKWRRIDAKETEIALLQAGQFEFLKGITTRAVV
jgi:uncharacterized protein YicC (UPF0701 family)